MDPPLLQIWSTPISADLPHPTTVLLNRPIRDVLPKINREPINISINDVQILKAHEDKCQEDSNTHRDSLYFL